MRSAYNLNSLLYQIMLASTNIGAGRYIAKLFKVDFNDIEVEHKYDYFCRLKETCKYL
jgi:hypothetical protein